MNDRKYQQAEAVALEVKQWGLSYGLFDDTPDKVAAAARALRRRDKIRAMPARERSSQGVYDELVQESRQYVKAGRLDEAEEKARKAQRMDVVSGPEDRPGRIRPARNRDDPGEESADLGSPHSGLGAGHRCRSRAGQRSRHAGVAEKLPHPRQQRPRPTRPSSGSPPSRSPDRISRPRPITGRGPGAGSPGRRGPRLRPGRRLARGPAGESPKDQGPAAAKPSNRGEQLLVEAKALFTNANYAAALQLAERGQGRQVRRGCPGRRADRPDRHGRPRPGPSASTKRPWHRSAGATTSVPAPS